MRPSKRFVVREAVVKTLALINDESGADEPYPLDVDDDLADLLAFTRSWDGEGANPKVPLNFHATFAALVGSPAPESVWFRQHLALRGVDRDEIAQRTR